MPTALFSTKIALAIQGLLSFHTNFMKSSSTSEKMSLNFDRDCTEFVDHFGFYGHFYNINSPNP